MRPSGGRLRRRGGADAPNPIADIVGDQGHAKRRIEPAAENGALIGNAIRIDVSEQGDAMALGTPAPARFTIRMFQPFILGMSAALSIEVRSSAPSLLLGCGRRASMR